MESAFDAFARHEERLQALSMRADRLRAPPDAVHAVPDRGRRLDHRAVGARGLHVLVGLPARRRRPPPDRAIRGVARRRRRRASASRFYCDNFVDLMGSAGVGARGVARSGSGPSVDGLRRARFAPAHVHEHAVRRQERRLLLACRLRRPRILVGILPRRRRRVVGRRRVGAAVPHHDGGARRTRDRDGRDPHNGAHVGRATRREHRPVRTARRWCGPRPRW